VEVIHRGVSLKYVVTGHYPTMCNGELSYVIVDIVCRSEKDATAVLEARKHTYKKLVITTKNGESSGSNI
jgi:hypothetical protein